MQRKGKEEEIENREAVKLYALQLLNDTFSQQAVQGQEKTLLISMKRETSFLLSAKDLWPWFRETTSWMILCGLEFDGEGTRL